MKIKNTLSRNKIIRFADAFIEVPVKSQWLAINSLGIVYATERAPIVTDEKYIVTAEGDSLALSGEATLVAYVEDFGGAQVISIEDLMAGI